MSRNSPFNYPVDADLTALEAEIASKAPINNPVFTGTVTLPGNPASSLQAATKGYTDAVANGLVIKPNSIVATTTSLPAYTYNNGASGVGATITMTATGIVAIDGRDLLLNDVVLIKDETAGNAPYNGLYDVTTAGIIGVALVLTRNVQMDINSNFLKGYSFVQDGPINSGNGFVCTNLTSPIVGTTDITFQQFSSAGQIDAGTGLTKIGNIISIDSTVVTLSDTQTLTNKTINDLTLTALATGFTIAGGTTSKTLTVPLNASVSGANTGDQTSVTGNAGTATALQTARNIGSVSFDGTSDIVPQTIQTIDEIVDTSCFIVIANASGNQSQQLKTNTGLTYDSTTNSVGATEFVGDLSGNASTSTLAATVTTNADLTGDVTSTGNATTIANAVVTEAMQTLSDNTTGNVRSTKHGYAPKSPADATTFLNGAAIPAFSVVKDSDLSLSDITTNDVSISKHGFAPKLPNNASLFLNGIGTYTAVAATAAASQAQQQAGIVNTVYTSPLTQQDHLSAAKAWVNFNGTGTIAIRDSYGVSSLTDNGVGDYSVNWTTSFSDTKYCVQVTSNSADNGAQVAIATLQFYNSSTNPLATGSARIHGGGTGGGGANADLPYVMVTAFGRT